MSKLFDDIVKMQEDTMKAIQPEVQPEWGNCKYCGTQEEISDLWHGFCDDCRQEQDINWIGVR